MSLGDPGLGFVGVHIGAGQHSVAREPTYLGICARACAAAILVLREGGSATEAATKATMVLEDEGETNAGYGSNLTERGSVEMDAALMDGGTLLHGAVGAMPGIKNPILVAKTMVQEQSKGLLPLGRVPPIFMAGEGAKEFAVRHGIESVPQESLISEKASKLYRHYKKKLDTFRQTVLNPSSPKESAKPPSSKRPKRDDDAQEEKRLVEDGGGGPGVESLDDRVSDTVGVVVMDCRGTIASTVSSGGIALKQPGRVGQASCYGCGCWAQNHVRPSNVGVGISTTGCGEHLVKTLLARELAQELGQPENPLLTLQNVMIHKFANSEFLVGVKEKLGGAIVLRHDGGASQAEFMWTHTTASLGLAYQTTRCQQPTARMSRLARTAPSGGTEIFVDSIKFSTRGQQQAQANGNNDNQNENGDLANGGGSIFHPGSIPLPEVARA